MGTHHQQIRAAPQRPVTLADRDVAALVGVLAILAGQVLSGEAPPSDPAAQRPPGAVRAPSSRRRQRASGQGAARPEPATPPCPWGVRRGAVDAKASAKSCFVANVTYRKQPVGPMPVR
jgi:hypothetical protein